MGWMDAETIESLEAQLEKKEKKEQAIKAKSEAMMRQAMTIGEVGAATAGLAYFNAKYGTVDAAGDTVYSLFNVPLDLGLAVVFHAAAWMGFAGKYEEDLHSLGTGALASFLARLGTNLGKAKPAAAGAPGATTAGLFGAGASPFYGTQQFAVRVPR